MKARIAPSFRVLQCWSPFVYAIHVCRFTDCAVLRFFAIGMEHAVTVYTTVQSCVALQPAAMFTNRIQMSLSIE